MNGEKRIRTFLRWISNYLTFFLLVAFTVTCCVMLFVSTLSGTLSSTLTAENLKAAAKLTFANVLLLSLVFSVMDAVRRKLTVERPAKHITDAAA